MNQDRANYSLHKTMQLEQALAILQRELEAQAIPRWREIAFTILNYETYTYGVAAAILIAYHCYLDYLAPAVQPSDIQLLRYSFAILSLVGIMIIISFCLNVPYFIRLAHHLLLAHRLGLSKALLAPWKAAWRRRWWRHAIVLFIMVVSVYVPLTYLSIYLMKMKGLDYAPLAGWHAWARLVLTGIVIVAILSTPLIRSARACLACLNQLYSSLKEQGTARQDKGLIQVPVATYETIAQIERAQISRERLHSIENSSPKAQDRFSVLKSSEARDQARSLDVSTRLRVEDLIDNLTMNPFPEGMSERLDTEFLQLPVPDTTVVIAYSVDTVARDVRIISIEQQGGQDGALQGSSR